MEHNIHDSFDQIKADEALKAATLSFVLNHKSAAKKKRFIPRYAAALVCMMLLFVGSGFSRQLYLTPVSYVDIDVNPSIELQLNRFGRVIKSSAYNDDGEVLLASLNLKNKTYEKALQLLVDAMNADGFLTEDSLLSITVQSQKKEAELLKSVQSCVSKNLRMQHLSTDQDIFVVDSDTKRHAHDWNVSPARYLAISKLLESDPTITVDECRGHSIRQLQEISGEGQGSHHRNRNGNGGRH